MTALIERSDENLSITDLVRSTEDIMNIQAYEALLDELEDLRIESVVRKRLQNLDKSQTISHEEMMKKFESHTKMLIVTN